MYFTYAMHEHKKTCFTHEKGLPKLKAPTTSICHLIFTNQKKVNFTCIVCLRLIIAKTFKTCVCIEKHEEGLYLRRKNFEKITTTIKYKLLKLPSRNFYTELQKQK